MSDQPPPPADHPTVLLIPGPIEFHPSVLQAMSHPSESHVGPGFVTVFGEALAMLRRVFQTADPASQPFVLTGSGTLGWDLVAANVVEPGEEVLVLNSGYFSDGLADCLATYGAVVSQVVARPGGRPGLDEVERALRAKKYRMVTVTHVDTSTGVLSDVRGLADLVRRVSADTLLMVDGVCSVGCEELDFDGWGLDAVVTASQKAIGCPAGLSISMFSARAIAKFKARQSPPRSYFASMKNWLPIMRNYEARTPSYFATPSPQLVRALHTALCMLLSRPLADTFSRHAEVSDRVKRAVEDMGLEQVAARPEDRAHAMTAIYLPVGTSASDVLPRLTGRGVIFAGGVHPALGQRYIRFGHMGVSVMDPERKDIDVALRVLREVLSGAGFIKP